LPTCLPDILNNSSPEELQSRHKRVYDEVIAKAKTHAWDPEIISGDVD